jgi:hypothetical protein
MMTLQYIVALAANAVLFVGTIFNQTTLEVSFGPVMNVEFVAGLAVEASVLFELYK